jgi:hypothetical protein
VSLIWYSRGDVHLNKVFFSSFRTHEGDRFEDSYT